MLEQFFHIKERGSTIGREIIGGLVTALSMLYILVTNAGILSAAGMDYTMLIAATAFATGVGTLLSAFISNTPTGLSTGLGVDAFFSFTLCLTIGYTWQQALAITFISGIIFLVVMLTPLRNKIVDAIPAPLKRAISVGIGLFIALIGLFNSGVVETTNGLLTMGNITSGAPLLAIIGIIITVLLMVFKVKGAILIGIIATTLIGIPMGITNATITDYHLVPVHSFFMKMQFSGLMQYGVITFLTSIFSLLILDIFDSVGTLTGIMSECDMIDENGNVKDKTMTKALIADAAATCTGAMLNVSTCTNFVEASSGVAAGARTGLAAVVTALVFFLSYFFAPIFSIIPLASTTAALVIVGVLMFKNVKYIDWENLEIAIPCFLTIASMPFMYSISSGIGMGIISYVLIKMIKGKFKEIHPLMYILAALFVLMFIL